MSECLGEGCLSVTGRPGKEHPISRAKVIGAEKVSSVMLLDEFIYRLANRTTEDDISKRSARGYFLDQFVRASTPSGCNLRFEPVTIAIPVYLDQLI